MKKQKTTTGPIDEVDVAKWLKQPDRIPTTKAEEASWQ
jgi:hypothetical protein